MTPRENYTIYISIAFDLEPWNPLIHNSYVIFLSIFYKKLAPLKINMFHLFIYIFYIFDGSIR